jgi:hypothetical protein
MDDVEDYWRVSHDLLLISPLRFVFRTASGVPAEFFALAKYFSDLGALQVRPAALAKSGLRGTPALQAKLACLRRSEIRAPRRGHSI